MPGASSWACFCKLTPNTAHSSWSFWTSVKTIPLPFPQREGCRSGNPLFFLWYHSASAVFPQDFLRHGPAGLALLHGLALHVLVGAFLVQMEVLYQQALRPR